MRIVMLAGILAASATPPMRNSEAGRVYARQVCSPCHAVTAEQASQRTTAIAQSIADTPGMTVTALCALLQTPHPKMPDLILTPDQSADVIAFVLSLGDHRQPGARP
jgi:mono/diheme cytochrome c family protein